MDKKDEEAKTVLKAIYDWVIEAHFFDFKEFCDCEVEKVFLSKAEIEKLTLDFKEYIQTMYEVVDGYLAKEFLFNYSMVEEMTEKKLPNNWWTFVSRKFRKIEELDNLPEPGEEERKILKAELFEHVQRELSGLNKN